MVETTVSNEIIDMLEEMGFNDPKLLTRINRADYSFTYYGMLNTEQKYHKRSDFIHHYEWLSNLCGGDVLEAIDLHLNIMFDDNHLCYEIKYDGEKITKKSKLTFTCSSEYDDELHHDEMSMSGIVKMMIMDLTVGYYSKTRNLETLANKL